MHGKLRPYENHRNVFKPSQLGFRLRMRRRDSRVTLQQRKHFRLISYDHCSAFSVLRVFWQFCLREMASDFENIVRQCLKNGELWEDPEFPALQSSVFYYQSTPSTFEWKRPMVRNCGNLPKGSGSVGRATASDIRGPWFESSLWQILQILVGNCI